VKFAISTQRDYEFARDFPAEHRLFECVREVLFSPVFPDPAGAWAGLDALAQNGGSAITDSRLPVPETGVDSRGILITYVPFRCAHFLSAAESWAEVIGARLGQTWSCYQFEAEACRRCDSCRLRLRAFAGAGEPDPIAYRAAVAS